jgi:hypothetical protein
MGSTKTISNQYYQVGDFVAYIIFAGFMNALLYIIFRITEKTN